MCRSPLRSLQRAYIPLSSSAQMASFLPTQGLDPQIHGCRSCDPQAIAIFCVFWGGSFTAPVGCEVHFISAPASASLRLAHLPPGVVAGGAPEGTQRPAGMIPEEAQPSRSTSRSVSVWFNIHPTNPIHQHYLTGFFQMVKSTLHTTCSHKGY